MEQFYNTRRFYGRRQGRPLSAARAAGLNDGLSSFLLDLDTLTSLFHGDHAWHLEIGFGAGERLAAEARQRPNESFIGCEAFINGVASLIRYLRQDSLNNIRIFPDDARQVLEVLPDHVLTTCWVLYPDPWPKRRHIARRILNPSTLDDLARVLRVGAHLVTATDVTALGTWMHAQLVIHQNFQVVYDSSRPPEGWIATRYEAKAREAGRDSRYLIAQRF